MMKSSTSFGFSSSLFLFFFFIVASIVVYSEAQSDCKYTLSFETGTKPEAGTDSSIKVTIRTFDGESLEIPDLIKIGAEKPGYDYFEKGNTDNFEVQAPCMKTTPCKINVTSDGSGQKPGWYLDYVSVSVSRVLLDIQRDFTIPPVFKFNQWLASDEPPNELTAYRNVCESS